MFNKKVTLTYFKKWDKTIHAEPCKSKEALANYCKKSDTRIDGPWEFGEKPACGGDHKTLDKNLVKMSQDEVKKAVHDGKVSIY